MPQNDPYAAFGGAVQKQAADADPYAAFGGGVASVAPEGNSEIHPLDATLHAIHDWWDQVSPVKQAQGLIGAIQHPAEAARGMGQQNLELWNKAKDSFSRGDYPGAIAHGINYALNGIPGLGSSIDEAGGKFQSGDVSGGVGQSLGVGTNLVAPVVAPKIASAVGRGLRRAAVPVAESALGVRAMNRAYGKTPGAAVLEETSGIRPSTVAESARTRLADLNTELENLAATSTTPGSLIPARDVIANRARTAAAGNSSYTPEELARMQSHLTDPQPGFGGTVVPAPGPQPGIATIADLQDPATILRMKREFGKDFTKWNPLHPKGEIGTARQVYRALDDELDRAVPGASDLNQRISSLIPVAERAETTDLNAGIPQRVLHRAAAHTGALVGALAGYREAGLPGGIAGLVVPELVASPEAQMAAARALHGTGSALTGPTAGRLAGAAAAVNGVRVNPYRQ